MVQYWLMGLLAACDTLSKCLQIHISDINLLSFAVSPCPAFTAVVYLTTRKSSLLTFLVYFTELKKTTLSATFNFLLSVASSLCILINITYIFRFQFYFHNAFLFLLSANKISSAYVNGWCLALQFEPSILSPNPAIPEIPWL